MRNEEEKIFAGELFCPGAPELKAIKLRSHNLCSEYNRTFEDETEKRAEILHDAEELLLAEAPIIPLTFGQNHYVFGGKIRNVDMDYYGYAYFTKTRLKNYQDYLPEAEEAEGE